MDPLSLLRDLLFDYTLRTVALGAMVLGITSGALGAFAVLRRQSLLGDAISHAALPGVALAFLLTGSKAPLVLVLGAAAAGWLGTLAVMGIVNATRIKDDSALGLVLSVFFGVGLVILTFIQKMPNANQAGLDRFLFGQAATMLEGDVVIMALLGVLALCTMLFLWKELKLLTFDRGFGVSLGLPARLLDVVLIALLVVAIVIGLQTVGVVLMSAMVIAPAAAARQWTDRLGVMVGLSAFFGGLAGVSGAVISSLTARLPTGPTVVLCATALVLFSVLFAPNRGLVWRSLDRRRHRRRLRTEIVLSDLYVLASQHERSDHGHSLAILRAMRPEQAGLRDNLAALTARGMVRQTAKDEWALTPTGLVEARRLAGKVEEIEL